MESPAESVCGSTGEPPTPYSPEKSDPSTHSLHLQRENNKLKRKIAVLKEKAEGTEELLSVYRELRTKHTELQLECDDLRLKKKDEDQLKWKLSEAENRAQKELEKRAKLQKQLSEALEHCESEQGSRISLLEQMRTEQETMVALRQENATLKRKLDQLTDEQKRTMTNWKAFEDNMTKLMNQTGSGFGIEGVGLIKDNEIDLKTPEITSQICSDLATPSDGHSVDHPAAIQAKSCPLLESSRLSHESSDFRIKSLGKQQIIQPMTEVTRSDLDGSEKCVGSDKLTARMIMNELKPCTEEDSVLCLVSRTLKALHEKHFPLSELIRSLCDCFLTCSSSIPVLDTPSNTDLQFLIPWCEAGSTDHTFFSKIMVFILQLDDRMETDLIKYVSSEILDTAMGLIEQKKSLMACSLIAGLGHLCKTKNQNQILSIALVEILSIDKNSTLIPVLCVLLHSCPELLTKSAHFQQSFLFDLVVGCLMEIITRILNFPNAEDPVVQFCSQKILSCGFQHLWWSSNQPFMPHQSLTVKLPTGIIPDQQIEQFLTFYKQLLTSKEGPPIPEKAWFELELGFVIITKHKGYHWIQGITSALIVHWIKDLEQKKLVKLGRVMGSVYARLLTRWKEYSNQFLGVVGMIIECLNQFEKRSLKPRSFFRELLHSYWKVMNTFLDDGKWKEWDVTQWEELKRGIGELRSRCDHYDVTSTLSEATLVRLKRQVLM